MPMQRSAAISSQRSNRTSAHCRADTSIADIPGLIEGASEARASVIKFLRHVKRTRMLFHLISLENVVAGAKGAAVTASVVEVYKTIRAELAQYGQGLDEKSETIILTKTDVVEGTAKAKKTVIDAAKKALKKVAHDKKADILTVSVLDLRR